MKKTIKLAVVAALALGTTSAFATNGSALIGMGAKTRGMAGLGIGMSHGAESALANPALITTVKNTEISFGGTVFMPNVESTLQGEPAEKSTANLNLIPEVSLATKINDNFYVGVGMWGTGGMGVDYRDDSPSAATRDHYLMVTNLQLMQFGVPLAYTRDGFSVGVTPLVQYGSLDINYDTNTSSSEVVGAGVSQDIQFGWNAGISYENSGFTVGAVYKSQIDMKYKGQLSNAMVNFGISGYTNDKLSTPAEVGIGFSYTMQGHTLGFDYKQIQWSAAKGYEDFGWKDQNVFTVGYEYEAKKWAARIGYNYAQSPIEEQTTATAGIPATSKNAFNLLGFPAIVESHWGVGGTVNVSDKASVDLAFTYAPEVSETYSAADGGGSYTIETKHSQTGVSAQLNYAF